MLDYGVAVLAALDPLDGTLRFTALADAVSSDATTLLQIALRDLLAIWFGGRVHNHIAARGPIVDAALGAGAI